MPDKKQFPISYISHCLSARAMFASRAQFTWWQNLLIIVFLNALIMIPVTLHYANMTTYPLERIVTKRKNGVLLPLMARNSVLTLEASSSHSLT